MVKNRLGCFRLRWFALAGLTLGASVIAGPGARGQAANGAWGPMPSAVRQTPGGQAAAGVVVGGGARGASEAEEPAAAPAEAAVSPSQGRVDPSGVVSAAPRDVAPRWSDPAAAGVLR